MKYLFNWGIILVSLLIIVDIIYSLIYIFKNKCSKEKIISLILYFLSLFLILIFLIVLNLDWLNYYAYESSAPFYAYVLVRSLEFLLPSFILLIISLILKRKKVTK